MQQRVANTLRALYITWLQEGGSIKRNGLDDLFQASHIALKMLNGLQNSSLQDSMHPEIKA